VKSTGTLFSRYPARRRLEPGNPLPSSFRNIICRVSTSSMPRAFAFERSATTERITEQILLFCGSPSRAVITRQLRTASHIRVSSRVCLGFAVRRTQISRTEPVYDDIYWFTPCGTHAGDLTSRPGALPNTSDSGWNPRKDFRES
jgi:hypothetical protein